MIQPMSHTALRVASHVDYRLVCVLVLLFVRCRRLGAMSQLSRSLREALYLMLWFWSTVQD